jgi:integrase
MSRTENKRILKDKFVDSLKPAAPGRRHYVWDAKVDGFGVQVTDQGTKSWILYRRVPPRNTPSRRKLGKVGEMSLAEARAKAEEWVRIIAREQDPKVEKEKARLAEVRKQDCTFAAVAEAFVAEKLPRERKGREVEQDIRRDLMPAWSARPIADIAGADVRAVVRAKARTAPAQARNLLAVVKRLLTWAIEQESYGLTSNAAETLKARSIVGAKRSRDRVLDNDELLALWRAAESEPYPAGAAYKVLMLTALRLNEVADARWSEFDPAVTRTLRQREDDGPVDWSHLKPEQLIWIVPAERMKGRNEDARPHAVPLTPDILRVVEAIPRFRSGDFCFSTTFGKSPVWMTDTVKRRMDARMLRILQELARTRGDDPSKVELRHWENHDIRRTVRSQLSRLKITEEAREAVLAHKRPGIKGVYDLHDYLDEKREALEMWAARLKAIVEPPPDNVVALRPAGRRS